MKNYNLIIIVGPTATGKTSLSVELAKMLKTEIINADSTQVYKHLNIGTAKATKAEMQGIKHHLINIKSPKSEFSVQEFKLKSLKIIKKLHKKNLVPIIVGGTGLYIDSLLNNYSYAQVGRNEKVRQKYYDLVERFGNEYVYNLLKEVDLQSAEKLHQNDVKRVIRALEIYELTGKPKSSYDNQTNNTMQTKMHSTKNTMQTELKPLIIGLNAPREMLYERINKRVDIMFENGLIDEVFKLYKKGLGTDLQSIKSIGYKELYEYFNKIKTLDEVKDQIKQSTRNYAKRQITWFNKNKNIVWYDISQQSVLEISKDIYNKITK